MRCAPRWYDTIERCPWLSRSNHIFLAYVKYLVCTARIILFVPDGNIFEPDLRVPLIEDANLLLAVRGAASQMVYEVLVVALLWYEAYRLGNKI